MAGPFRRGTGGITSTDGGSVFTRTSVPYNVDSNFGLLGLEDYPPNKTIVSAPQDVTGVREAVGYAVTFSALAALLSGTPQSVAAADYTVGTHQAVIADSQSHGRVWGTPPQLIPSAAAPAPIGRTLVAAQEHIDSGRATLWGKPYVVAAAAADSPIARTLVSAPQQIDSGQAWVWHPSNVQPPDPIGGATYTVGSHQAVVADAQARGKVWGTSPALFQVAGTDKPVGKTLVAAPEQVPSGSASVWGTDVPFVAGTDKPIGRTWISAPQQIDSGQAWVWGTDVASGEVLISTRNVFGGQDSPEQSGGGLWGQRSALGAPVAGTDKPVGHTLVSAPEQQPYGAAMRWGQRIAQDAPTEQTTISRNYSISQDSTEQLGTQIWGRALALYRPPDPTIGRTLVAAPEQQPYGQAWIWGTKREYVFGTDTRVGTFIQAIEAFYEPVQKGLILTPSADLIPPPIVPPTDTFPSGGGGGGGRIVYKGKPGKDAAWLLNKMLDDVVAEVMYRDIQKAGSSEEKLDAATLVSPYADDRKVVDWKALESDAKRIAQMISLWRKIEDRKLAIKRQQEEWFMLGD